LYRWHKYLLFCVLFFLKTDCKSILFFFKNNGFQYYFNRFALKNGTQKYEFSKKGNIFYEYFLKILH